MNNALTVLPKQKIHHSIMNGMKKWMERLDSILEDYVGDPYFNNELLAKELAISERNLFRKINEITGMSPQKYIRRYRLNLAMNLLVNGEYRTVKETAYAVGYLNVSYFIAQFEKDFGRKPLQVLQEEGWR